MNSFDYQKQSENFKKETNQDIAKIYERMLGKDSSALFDLQQIKIHPKKLTKMPQKAQTYQLEPNKKLDQMMKQKNPDKPPIQAITNSDQNDKELRTLKKVSSAVPSTKKICRQQNEDKKHGIKVNTFQTVSKLKTVACQVQQSEQKTFPQFKQQVKNLLKIVNTQMKSKQKRNQNKLAKILKPITNKSTDNQASRKKQVKKQNSQFCPKNKNVRKIVHLPQLKKQRQELTKINSDEKEIQKQIIDYHHLTKSFVAEVFEKYGINVEKNETLRKKIDGQLSIQTQRSDNTKNRNSSSNSLQMNRRNEQETDECYRYISIVEDQLDVQKRKMRQIENQLQSNYFHSYWLMHGNGQNSMIQENSFEEIENQINDNAAQSQVTKGSLTGQSQEYRTLMSQSKSKNFVLRKIKQYDTNRSFQQFANSRSRVAEKSKVSHSNHYQGKKLNQIQESQHQQDTLQPESNKIIINERLRKLLL